VRKAALCRLLLEISKEVGESKRGKDESQWSQSSSVMRGLLKGLNLIGRGSFRSLVLQRRPEFPRPPGRVIEIHEGDGRKDQKEKDRYRRKRRITERILLEGIAGSDRSRFENFLY